jgi:hypothetical protein
MISRITKIFQQQGLVAQYAALATALLVLMVVISFAVTLIILVRLPADYLRIVSQESGRAADRGLFFRAGTVLRNLSGALLIVIGVILSLPGIPGQGLLTLLVGILLLDFPGKHKLVRKVLGRPSVLKAANRLRKRFSRPPLLIT